MNESEFVSSLVSEVGRMSVEIDYLRTEVAELKRPARYQRLTLVREVLER